MRVRNIFVVVILVLSGAQAAWAFDNGDFESRNTVNISWKVQGQWKMTLEEEMYLGDNAKDLYYQHTDIGVVYGGLADWIDIGLNYRLVFEEKNNDWQQENRPHVNMTLKADYHDFKFSSRSRMELRIKKHGEDKLRFRNIFKVVPPLQWTKYCLQPYLADEVFLDTDGVEFNKNRAYAGFSAKFSRHVGAEIYYLLESAKSAGNDWSNASVIGTKIKLSF